MFLTVIIVVVCISLLYCVIMIIFQTKKKQRITQNIFTQREPMVYSEF